MSETPRAYTKEEVRERFLNHVRGVVKYWSDLPGKTKEEAVAGAAFSILVGLDGEAGFMPGFAVIPSPHPDDQKFHESRGENWYPDFKVCDDCGEICDIAGNLHDLLKC